MNTKQNVWLLLSALCTNAIFALDMSSTNFEITWAVSDGGSAPMTSPGFALNQSLAQSSPTSFSSTSNYQLQGGFMAAPDTDTDRVKDFMDNCTLDINTTQYDSNGDGYGNLCDPDLDNNGAVNFGDYAMLTNAFLSAPGSANWNADADLTGDNLVNFADISLFQFFFLQVPGPSGNAP